MGGFAVASAAAHDPKIAGVIMISAWNIASGFSNLPDEQEEAAVAKFVKQQTKNDLAPLAGCTTESLGHEVFRKRSELNFVNFAPSLVSRPVFIITSNDGLAGEDDKLFAALQKAGDKNVHELHIATDHSYSDHRVALVQAVMEALPSIEAH